MENLVLNFEQYIFIILKKKFLSTKYEVELIRLIQVLRLTVMTNGFYLLQNTNLMLQKSNPLKGHRPQVC